MAWRRLCWFHYYGLLVGLRGWFCNCGYGSGGTETDSGCDVVCQCLPERDNVYFGEAAHADASEPAKLHALTRSMPPRFFMIVFASSVSLLLRQSLIALGSFARLRSRSFKILITLEPQS